MIPLANARQCDNQGGEGAKVPFGGDGVGIKQQVVAMQDGWTTFVRSLRKTLMLRGPAPTPHSPTANTPCPFVLFETH